MKCFVIMPFGNPELDAEGARRLDFIYHDCIKPTVEGISVPGSDERLICHRADQERKPGDIVVDIIENLANSDIVIADLTGRNPNVFYELGVRHAIRNNTILISQDINDIPFDLRPLRAISYKYDPAHLKKFQLELTATIGTILSAEVQTDNPVRKFLYNQELEKLVKSPPPLGYDIVLNLLSEVSSLRSTLDSQMHDMKKLVAGITSMNALGEETSASNPSDLSVFEGVWRTENSNSLICCKVVNGKLLAPYCYSGNSKLTGHYFNFHHLGGTLVARFAWLRRPVDGYIFYRIVSPGHLSGGWWYEGSIPEHCRTDITKVNDSIPGMFSDSWVKLTRKSFPDWAKRYFDAPPNILRPPLSTAIES